jgi:hypothetical protein
MHGQYDPKLPSRAAGAESRPGHLLAKDDSLHAGEIERIPGANTPLAGLARLHRLLSGLILVGQG